MSAEAVVGTGVTIAALGVLCLLLGWAQWMRQVHSAGMTLLIIGASLFAIGVVATIFARSRRKG